jgi:hypothetical protein
LALAAAPYIIEVELRLDKDRSQFKDSEFSFHSGSRYFVSAILGKYVEIASIDALPFKWIGIKDERKRRGAACGLHQPDDCMATRCIWLIEKP